jgi:hypothetical protein
MCDSGSGQMSEQVNEFVSLKFTSEECREDNVSELWHHHEIMSKHEAVPGV